MKRIAIFASGSGSNAENIINYFNSSSTVSVHLVLTNDASAPVLERSKRLNVPSVVFSREELIDINGVLKTLIDYKIDFVVLAGFLWLFPSHIIDCFKGAIINIHPALLPKFGGKGMFGMHVHEAVIKAKEKKSGITIHYVNEQFDAGEIIFQATCDILPSDTADDVAAKVHELEYLYFPQVIAELLDA